jgi:predicted kinase
VTPCLVVLNGPPAIGKSTLARRYVADHPLALNLDPDSVRRMLGGWRAQALRASSLARAMSLEMARVHLGAGYDVIVPQYLGRPQFLAELQQIAAGAGARFVEFVLLDARDNAVNRFAARTERAATVADVEAGELIASLGGQPALEAMYDRLLLVLSHRPGAQVVQCPDGSADEVYAELVRRLAAGSTVG